MDPRSSNLVIFKKSVNEFMKIWYIKIVKSLLVKLRWTHTLHPIYALIKNLHLCSKIPRGLQVTVHKQYCFLEGVWKLKNQKGNSMPWKKVQLFKVGGKGGDYNVFYNVFKLKFNNCLQKIPTINILESHYLRALNIIFMKIRQILLYMLS